MGGAPLLLALAVVSIDYGYKPDGAGGLEYIVQIHPSHLAMLTEAGKPIECPIDPEIQGHVSRLVIQLGTGNLPRDDGGLRNQSPSRGSVNFRNPSGVIADLADNGPLPIPTLMKVPLSQDSASSAQRPQSDTNSQGGAILPLVGAAAEKLRDAGSRMIDNTLRIPGNSPSPAAANGPGLQIPTTISPPDANSQYTAQNNTQLGNSPAAGGFGYNPLGGSIMPGANTSTDYNSPPNGYNTPTINPNVNTAATNNLSGRDASNWRADAGRRVPSTSPYTPDPTANPSLYSTTGQTTPNSPYGVSTGNRTLGGINSGAYPPAAGNSTYNSTPDAYGNYPSLNANTGTNNNINGFGQPSAQSSSILPRNRDDPTNAGFGTAATNIGNQYTNLGDRPTYPGNQNYSNNSNTARSDVWGSSGVSPINNLSLAANTNLPNRGDYLDNNQLPNAGSIRPPSYNQSSYDLGVNGISRIGANHLGSKQPFSQRMLNGLLLFSLIGNAYMGMAVGRVINRYRDLAASIRGTVSV